MEAHSRHLRHVHTGKNASPRLRLVSLPKKDQLVVRKPTNQFKASLFILISVNNCKINGIRASCLFLAFKQGYASLSNSTFRILYDRILYDEYFFERRKIFFFENFSFFHVTMKFVRNLPTSTGKWGAGEGYLPSNFQMAYFFKIFETFRRKKRSTETPS